MEKISGGYYIKARKIQESEISNAPPHVREIWDLLLMKCNYINGKLNRGECLTSYKQIQEYLSWYVGWRKHTYTKGQCETAMKWLKKAAMITTMKTTRGVVVTVCNYEHYQNPKNYETYMEKTGKPTGEPQTDDTILKEGEEVKKEEKKGFVPPTLEEFKDYFKQNGFLVKVAEKAWTGYDVTDWHDSNGKKIKSWKQKCQHVWFRDDNKDKEKIVAELNPHTYNPPLD